MWVRIPPGPLAIAVQLSGGTGRRVPVINSWYNHDIVEQFGDAGVWIATGHNLERLQQWHAGAHHGRQLAGKQGDIFFSDLAAKTTPATFDLDDRYTLTA